MILYIYVYIHLSIHEEISKTWLEYVLVAESITEMLIKHLLERDCALGDSIP